MNRKEYERILDELLEEIFQAVTERGWNWTEFAQRANLSIATVYRLGNYTTRLPHFQTMLKLCRAVSMDLVIRFKDLRRKVA